MAALTVNRDSDILVRDVVSTALSATADRLELAFQISPGDGYVMMNMTGSDPSETVGIRFERGVYYGPNQLLGTASVVAGSGSVDNAVKMILIMPGYSGAETARVEFWEVVV
jgi:hypothetical protein